MKRLAATLGAAVILGLASAPAASAQEGDDFVKIELQSPSEGVYSGLVSLQGRASSAAGIKRAELFVDNYVVAVEEPNDYRRDVDLVFDWDSRFVPELDESSPNGRYEVGMRAVANGERHSKEESIKITIDNSPETPTRFRADADGAAVSLSWVRNPEPDILYYLVQRNSGDGYVNIAKRKDPGFYEIADAGTHYYRVLAVRRSPVIEGGQVSFPTRSLGIRVSSKAADDSGGGFGAGGKRSASGGLAVGGLPDLTLSSGLPVLPGAGASGPDRLGDFSGKLPYGKMKVPAKFRLVKGAEGAGRDRWWNVIPPDGLRWVAAGALLIVMSLQARLFAKRLIALEARSQ
jgi:hypothetical protein